MLPVPGLNSSHACRVSLLVACVLTQAGCATQPVEVVRLPPLTLALGPGGDPLLAWPTPSPPAPIDAFHLPSELMRRSWWKPYADYCIDPSGRVTSVEVFHSRVPRRIERQIRDWRFSPWEGASDARYCESALMYDDEERLGRLSRATIVVYLPVIPPVAPLAADGKLEHAPARLLPDAHAVPHSFWDVVPEGQADLLEPRFGEIIMRYCTDSEGRPTEFRELEVRFEGLDDRQALLLVKQMWQRHAGGWRFAPRIEAGLVVQDCEVELRYGVWIIHDSALSYHERLFEILDVKGYGLGYRPANDERAPWAEHGPIIPVEGSPTPTMLDTPSWLPPYELAATMPLTMPTRTIRVRFCVPAAGGHPSEVRVVHSDARGAERALARLVAEGVARWRADASEGGDEARSCGEVEWQIGRAVASGGV